MAACTMANECTFGCVVRACRVTRGIANNRAVCYDSFVRRARLALVAIGATALIWLGFAIADQTTPAPDPGPIAKAVAAGKHVRIDGPRGPIHVWIPAGYHADT